MQLSKIRVSGIVKESTVDGPGIRYVIFTQGCQHNCIGCHNPHTHSLDGGYELDCKTIIDEVLADPLLEGLTFSGGEPFLQAEKLYNLIQTIKDIAPHLNFIAYSGFTYEQLLNNTVPSSIMLLNELDILIDGPFILALKDELLTFRGSSNQRVIDINKSRQKNKIIMHDFKEE